MCHLSNHVTARRSLPARAVLPIAFAAGAVPFSGLAARLIAGVDLRRRGSGTVSGTGLYEVSGFGPLAIAGSLDVAKGSLGPLLAGRQRPVLAALATAAAISGHNWSPLLGGAGGRGISPALGATLIVAPGRSRRSGCRPGRGKVASSDRIRMSGRPGRARAAPDLAPRMAGRVQRPLCLRTHHRQAPGRQRRPASERSGTRPHQSAALRSRPVAVRRRRAGQDPGCARKRRRKRSRRQRSASGMR